MNEAQNINPVPASPSTSTSTSTPESSGWSWGAFMTDPIFLIGLKKYKKLWWYLLGVVPFLGPIFLIGFKIYLGNKGREISTTTTFLSEDERRGFMKGLDHAGKVTFFAALISIGVIIVLLILGISFFSLIFSKYIKFIDTDKNTSENTQNIPLENFNLPSYPEIPSLNE